MSDSRIKSIDDRIVEAQELIKIHKDYEGAEKIFLSVVKEDPEDDRGWYGLLRACTCRFDAVAFLIEKHCIKIPEEYNDYYQKACETSNAKNREIIKKRWSSFVEDYKELYDLCQKKKVKRKEELISLGLAEEEKKPQKTSSSGDDLAGFAFLLFLIFLVILFAAVTSKGHG